MKPFAAKPLPTQYQGFIFTRTCSRWLPDKGRRETWTEAVSRYAKFFMDRLPNRIGVIYECTQAVRAVLNLDVMPSMRALWAAGPALERENVSAYNCPYTVIDSPTAMAEMLYILMYSTGVGFSVEKQYVSKLPEVPEYRGDSDEPCVVFEDSRIGWAQGFLTVLESLYRGTVPT